MTLSKSLCLYVFIFLYGGAIITLFIRAFLRKSLLKDYVDLKGEHVKSANRFLQALLAIPNKMKVLINLGKSVDTASDVIQRRFKYFQLLTWVAVMLIILLVIFSAVAHRICEA